MTDAAVPARANEKLRSKSKTPRRGLSDTQGDQTKLNARGRGEYLTCPVREVGYNANLETRDEDVVWVGEDGPYRHHIGCLIDLLAR